MKKAAPMIATGTVSFSMKTNLKLAPDPSRTNSRQGGSGRCARGYCPGTASGGNVESPFCELMERAGEGVTSRKGCFPAHFISQGRVEVKRGWMPYDLNRLLGLDDRDAAPLVGWMTEKHRRA